MGTRWPAAVKALSMAICTEVSFAAGMRVKCSRCRVESTRAMLKSVWCFWISFWKFCGLEVDGLKERVLVLLHDGLEGF